MSLKDKAVENSPYRLPVSVVPSVYEMCIEPDLKNFTFSGDQKVTINIRQPVDEIVLNSADISISKAVLTDEDGTQLVGTVTHDPASERATIKLDGQAGAGSWQLELKYEGAINNMLKGF